MRMPRLASAVAVLAVLLATGCVSTTTGTPVAGKDAAAVRSAVTLSDDGYGVVLGISPDAAIDLFIEPQCPHCGHFVQEYGDAIGDYIADGRLTVTIRPLTFLDSGSNDYSARATNAIFLVASPDESPTPALVWGFVQALYDELMTTASLADDDGLAQIANDVGVSADTVNRIAAGEPAVDGDEVSEGNLAVMDEIGVAHATPTVYDTVHEVDVDINDSHWLDDVSVK